MEPSLSEEEALSGTTLALAVSAIRDAIQKSHSLSHIAASQENDSLFSSRVDCVEADLRSAIQDYPLPGRPHSTTEKLKVYFQGLEEQSSQELGAEKSRIERKKDASIDANSSFKCLRRISLEHATIALHSTGELIPEIDFAMCDTAKEAIAVVTTLAVLQSIWLEGIDHSKLLSEQHLQEPDGTAEPFDHIRFTESWGEAEELATHMEERLDAFSTTRTPDERREALAAARADHYLMDSNTFRTFVNTFKPIFFPSENDKHRLETSFDMMRVRKTVDFMQRTLSRLEERMAQEVTVSISDEDIEMTDA